MTKTARGTRDLDLARMRWQLCARGLSPFTWLIYIGFWVILPYYRRDSRDWIYLGSAVAIFLPCFVGGLYGSLGVRRLSLLGMLALALVYVPVNESAFGIYFYLPWFLLSVVETDVMYFWLVGLECVVIMAQAYFSHPQLDSWEWSVGVGVCALSGTNALRLRQQERSNARLRMAHDEIEALAKTAERERIARDLHDVLGHTLSLISVKSELAARLLATDPERTAQELQEIQNTARRALTEVRQTVSGYRAQGLENEFTQACVALRDAGVEMGLRPAGVPRLPVQIEASLSLILREAVTNIIRHAGATSVDFVFLQERNSLTLEVRDNGRGMRGEEGNGLQGMRERVSDLGGQLSLVAGPNHRGTTLRVQLPLAGASEQHATPVHLPEALSIVPSR